MEKSCWWFFCKASGKSVTSNSKSCILHDVCTMNRRFWVGRDIFSHRTAYRRKAIQNASFASWKCQFPVSSHVRSSVCSRLAFFWHETIVWLLTSAWLSDQKCFGNSETILLARKTTPVVSPPALGGTDTTADRNSHRFHATDFPLPSRLSGRRSAPYWPAVVSHCGRPGNAHWGGRGRALRFRLGARGPRRRCHERRCRAHAGRAACAAGAARAGRGAGGCGRPPQAVGFLSAREPHPERHGAHLQACTGLLLLPGSACRASVSLWEPEALRAAEVRRGVALFASLPPDRPGGASGRGAGGAPSPGLRNRWWLGAASARRRAVAWSTVCGSGNVGDKSWGWNALCGVSAVNQIRAVFENIESYYVNVRPLTLFF